VKNPYAKEGLGTVGFLLLYLIMGHTGLWLAPFTEKMNLQILGFPIHYFGAVILGWIGLFAVSIFYVKWADKVDSEIESYDEQEDSNYFESSVKMGSVKSGGE
jgi:uncharacterized membrane protein